MTLGCGGCEAPADRGGEGRADRGDTEDGGGVDLDVASEGDLVLDAEIDLDAALDDTLLSDDLPISEDVPVSDDTPISDDAAPDPLRLERLPRSLAPGDQAWLDALWAALVAAPAEKYFGDSIKMLVMIIVSNNGWSP